MIARLTAWWCAEMRAMLPGWLRRLGRPRSVLTVQAPPRAHDPTELGLSLLERRRTRDLGSLADLTSGTLRRLQRARRNGRLEIAALAPPGEVLQTTVTLPSAARADLTEALRYELDQVTPFDAAELYSAVAGSKAQPKANRVEVSVVFMPRASIDPVLHLLERASLPAHRLETVVSDRDGGTRALNLLPPVTRPWTMGARLTAVLAAAACVAGALWLWLEWQGRNSEAETLRASLAIERRAAVAAHQTRLAETEGSGIAYEAYALRQRTPLVVAILSEATALMPDDTWIDLLRFDGTMLELTGHSAAATRLISLFDAHKRFRNPVFRTPVTRSQANGAERFVLAVEVVSEDPATTVNGTGTGTGQSREGDSQ